MVNCKSNVGLLVQGSRARRHGCSLLQLFRSLSKNLCRSRAPASRSCLRCSCPRFGPCLLLRFKCWVKGPKIIPQAVLLDRWSAGWLWSRRDRLGGNASHLLGDWLHVDVRILRVFRGLYISIIVLLTVSELFCSVTGLPQAQVWESC